MTTLSCPFAASPQSLDRSIYIEALRALGEQSSVPPVILGAARYVIAQAPPAPVNWIDVQATLELVTEDFWRVAGEALDGFDWPVRYPDDVRFDAAEFQIQWQLARELFTVLQTAGAYGSKRTDRQRRGSVRDIVTTTKRLQTLLDSSTGHDATGDYRGLSEFRVRELVEAVGAARSDDGFRVGLSRAPRDHAEENPARRRVLDELTLQDLLSEVIEQAERQAEHVEFDRYGSSRQARFVNLLRSWFEEVYAACGETERKLPYGPCVNTASAILAARHPEVELVPNPARSRYRRDDL